MTKQSNKSGFAQDINAVFTLSDRTHKSTLQYFMNKFSNDIDWNTNSKNEKIQNLQDENLNDYIEHKEHGVVLDNDKILQRNRDIESQQLFPETHANNELDINVMDKLQAAYEAKQQAS